jgi:hypothetical protein
MPLHAPIAGAIDSTAAADVTLRFMSCRQPKTMSARSDSSHATA